ncbi:hypothetical protein AB0L64_05030 [Kribbella sp. NPDC051936]|uniref:hypothetical protein n=1 Tax=Kribbella sp. NPDC051936 TaxID=3154946 RepID=UPI0034293D8B
MVTEAVRAAGIPPSPDGIFLYTSRTPGLMFDTTEQKAAWGAGYVTIAPGVKLGSAGTVRVDFGDGSNVSATVLDPRRALTEAIGTPYDNCGHLAVPASTCKLTISAGSLKTAAVDTSRGRATVPAWSFTVRGLSRPIVAVAISQDVLKPLAEPTPPPGLAEPDRDGPVVGRLTRVEGNTIAFTLHHGACDTNLRAHAIEYDDMVLIGGSRTTKPVACRAVGISTPTTLTLTQPLGNRPVINATTGTRLTFYPHLK